MFGCVSRYSLPCKREFPHCQFKRGNYKFISFGRHFTTWTSTPKWNFFVLLKLNFLMFWWNDMLTGDSPNLDFCHNLYESSRFKKIISFKKWDLKLEREKKYAWVMSHVSFFDSEDLFIGIPSKHLNVTKYTMK